MNWGTAPKHVMPQVTQEVLITKSDTSNTTAVTVTADANALKAPTDALINALVSDKLIEKDNYTLTLTKGKLTLNDKEQTAEVTAKYKALIDALGGADLNLKYKNK
jgi:hypothetical protein